MFYSLGFPENFSTTINFLMSWEQNLHNKLSFATSLIIFHWVVFPEKPPILNFPLFLEDVYEFWKTKYAVWWTIGKAIILTEIFHFPKVFLFSIYVFIICKYWSKQTKLKKFINFRLHDLSKGRKMRRNERSVHLLTILT